MPLVVAGDDQAIGGCLGDRPVDLSLRFDSRFASRPRLLVDRELIGHDHPTDLAAPFWLATVAADVTARRDGPRRVIDRFQCRLWPSTR